MEEGDKYKYAHRSFQTYFAAYYTSVQVTDDQQKEFFRKEINKEYSLRKDFFFMLYRLEGERCINNILEPGIKDILSIINNEESDCFALLKIFCQAIVVHDDGVGRGLNSTKHMEIPYERNIIMLFEDLFFTGIAFNAEISNQIIEKLNHVQLTNDYIEIETTDLLLIEPEDLKNELLDLIYQYFEIMNLLKSIKNWDAEQNKKRENMKKEYDSDEMLLFL